MKTLIATLAFLAILGAGCAQPISSVANPEPIGAPSPEGFVEFRNGFGPIPGKPPKPVETGAVSVLWNVAPPKMPTEATVLRREPTLPDSSFLQNITTALRIPAGALRATPVAERAQIDWRDANGYRWSFDAETNALTFVKIDAKGPATAYAPADETGIIAAAEDFVKNGGLTDPRWGNPTIWFSWKTWWERETAAGRCMTAANIEVIRSIAERPTVWPEVPALGVSGRDACVTPEFPSRVLVRFQLTQDDQLVYDEYGGVAIAEIVVRTDTKTVESGAVELVRELDRSNYPVKSQAIVLQELRFGGVRGSRGFGSGDRISVTAFDYALYRHRATVNGVVRTYFIPALVAKGQVTHANGTTEGYVTLVPLVSDDAFAGK